MRTLSILGDSISTYAGVSSGVGVKNKTTVNNRDFYGTGVHGVMLEDTWWMQVANDMQNCCKESLLLLVRRMPLFYTRCKNVTQMPRYIVLH